MTNSPKSSNNWSLYRALIISTLIIGLVVFFYAQIDKKIESHPGVIELKINQRSIQENQRELKLQLNAVEVQLRTIDKKLDLILAPEFGKSKQ